MHVSKQSLFIALAGNNTILLTPMLVSTVRTFLLFTVSLVFLSL